MPNIPTTGDAEGGSTFPATAYVYRGNCSGLCRRSSVDVVPVLLELDVGPKATHELALCVECLADFAVAQGLVKGRVFVLAVEDGERHWRLVAASPKDGGTWNGILS